MPLKRIPGRLLAAAAVVLLASAVWAQNRNNPPRTGAAANTVYVKASSAIVREGPAANAPQVAVVGRGTALTVLATASGRHQVRLPDGRVGFIPQINVTTDPPTADDRRFAGVLREDRGAGELRTTTSMRGLSPTAETMAQQQQAPPEAVEAVRAMEELAASIKPADIDMFLREGKVTPP